MDGSVEVGYPPNLIYLLIIECFFGTYLIYSILFIPKFMVGNIKYIILIILLLMIMLGYLILDLPDNTPNGITLFTLDLVTIPFFLMMCFFAKIFYDRLLGKQSSQMTTYYPKPTAGEATILASPPLYRTSGGGRKRRRK